MLFEFVMQFDCAVLKFFNVTVASPGLDQFWRTVTQLHKVPVVQIVALPALLVALFYRWRWHALKPLAMVALTVGLSDAAGYRVIKNQVRRPRPFENPAISIWVRKVGDAHGSSFPSNHAANSFAAAGVLGLYFARGRKYFVTFALIVALSRVALGVHYPTDVLCGALLGTLIAFFVNALIISPYNFLRLPEPVVRHLPRKSRRT